MRSFSTPLGLVLGAVMLIAGSVVSAHPKLVKSKPAAGAVLAKAPEVVQVWFHEELDTKGSPISVWDAKNVRVDRGDGKVNLDDRMRLEVGLRSLGKGKYTVRWKAMADDDKGVTQGSFRFSVK